MRDLNLRRVCVLGIRYTVLCCHGMSVVHGKGWAWAGDGAAGVKGTGIEAGHMACLMVDDHIM